MDSREQEDNAIYKVVAINKEQYSIWFRRSSTAVGVELDRRGTKSECLAYIKGV